MIERLYLNRDHFINEAIENVKTQQSFYYSIIFLRKILNTFQVDKYRPSISGTTVSTVLKEIYTKVNVFEAIITAIDTHFKKLEEKGKSMMATSASSAMALSTMSLQAQQLPQEDFVKVCINFIEFSLMNSSIIISFDNI